MNYLRGWKIISQLLLITTLVPCPALGDDRFVTEWETNCLVGDQRMMLTFRSKSGHDDADDMDVVATINKKKIKIPLPPALYVKRGIVSEVKNVCRTPNDLGHGDVGGFQLKDGNLLLWLSSDNRPGWDTLSLVLLNPSEAKVLDTKPNIGNIKAVGAQNLAIRPKNTGYEVRLEREWMKNTGADSAENSIEDWMLVKIIDNKIETKWAR